MQNDEDPDDRVRHNRRAGSSRLPVAQFVLTAAIAAVFVWLDSNGALDGVGRWMGRTLREVLDAVSED